MGWQLHAIAAFSGHRHTETTLQYIHLSGPDVADKLAAGMQYIHALARFDAGRPGGSRRVSAPASSRAVAAGSTGGVRRLPPPRLRVVVRAEEAAAIVELGVSNLRRLKTSDSTAPGWRAITKLLRTPHRRRAMLDLVAWLLTRCARSGGGTYWEWTVDEWVGLLRRTQVEFRAAAPGCARIASQSSACGYSVPIERL